MKKVLVISIILILLFDCQNILGYSNCNDYKNQLDSFEKAENTAYLNYINSYYKDIKYNNEIYISAKNNRINAEKNYNNCIIEQEQAFDNGYNAYDLGRYEDAINYFKQYFNYNTDFTSNSYKKAQNNLMLSYKALAGTFFDKKDFNNALTNYKLALSIDNKNSNTLTNIGACYANLRDYDNALLNFQEAYKYAVTTDSIKNIEARIESVKLAKKQQELEKNAPTNDVLSGYQYYLKQLNIPNAWNKVRNNNQVVVAVIDDGININHPDLINSIWVSKNAKYGDSKVIDFVGDGMPANLPVGEHGTMVAGIIGATQNNNEGIAGIAKNVKLMPLRVFDTKGGASEESVIKAINYAIDNGANIINLSLGMTQFSYSTKYDVVIKRAFDSGIIVIIAAGNGDLLSGQNTGVNLTNNPISPVCNNEGKYKYSIGVLATDADGYRTNWTNYGNCATFGAPGVGIISTSIPEFNSKYGINYNSLDGTSFSAPIISGIIALGYNQYGWINPTDVYDALEESKIQFKLPDGQNSYKIDASKYLDILGTKLEKRLNAQKQINYENSIKQKAEIAFNGIKSKLSKTSHIKKTKTYNSLLNQLNGIKPKIKGDKLILVNHLIYLINKELGNTDYIDLGDLLDNIK